MSDIIDWGNLLITFPEGKDVIVKKMEEKLRSKKRRKPLRIKMEFAHIHILDKVICLGPLLFRLNDPEIMRWVLAHELSHLSISEHDKSQKNLAMRLLGVEECEFQRIEKKWKGWARQETRRFHGL